MVRNPASDRTDWNRLSMGRIAAQPFPGPEDYAIRVMVMAVYGMVNGWSVHPTFADGVDGGELTHSSLIVQS